MPTYEKPEDAGNALQVLLLKAVPENAYGNKTLNHLAKLGARRGALEAKIFGGGRVMASLASSQVGDRNARFVVDYLKLEGIPVVAQDLLDVYPRKVYYFPASGRVMVKKLVKVANDTVAEREREYEARLQGGSVAGEIELFG